MKIISWNVNGIRAAYRKGLLDFINQQEPDILCLQETKAHPGQLNPEQTTPSQMVSDFSAAIKKGYSGVATFTREHWAPQKVIKGIGQERYDSEGRFVITRHQKFDLYNIYFPSGTSGDLRQKFKYDFLDAITSYFKDLSKKDKKRAIVCGDFNICHKAIDIHHPEKAEKLELSGFLPDERLWMDQFVDLGFTDSFRHVNGDIKNVYSWWTYRAGARSKNLGWRIDYIFVNNDLADSIVDASIMTEVMGSDHAPITITLDI